MALVLNSRLGRYEIRSQLGAGGMGEVYLALDAQLDRTIALKTLPSDVVLNDERMRRFVREAKASAALNHPNIAHIYEIGESNGTHFIAMEYIDGATLGAKIHAEKTPLNKLLNYLAQVAEGLGKAHAAGIVHRDLKPDNIMVTRDGYAKILDFGLAKLVEPQAGVGNDSSGETATAILAQHSAPGIIMGTVGYMSPEQAQGRTREIDHRSDIFSFGCILYEAATRQKAFAGKDPLDSLHKIVYAPTPQIKDVNVDAPADLQRIVRRCLAKEPDKRYQSIKEVAIELDELRQELNDRDNLDESAQPESNGEWSAISSRDTKTVSTQQPAAHTTQTEVTHSTSSAEYLVSGIKSHKVGVLLALTGLVVAIAVTLGFYKYYWSIPTKRPPFQDMRITKLTFNGKATSAVISPDGKQVVYVLYDGGLRSLWLRQVATGTDVKLTEPEDTNYFGLTISPDGNFLYYAYGGLGIQNRELYRMPVLGGSPRKVVDNISGPIGFSPDGKQIAFVRGAARPGGSALLIANADGTEERQVAAREGGPNRFGNFFYGGVAWSPDGKRIATVARGSDSGGRFQNVIEVPVEGGPERVLTSKKWYQIQRLSWLADGSGLLMTAAETASESRTRQIWHLSYPGGEARKITNDLNGYTNISLNADSSVLVTIQENHDTDIWVAPDGDAGRAHKFTSVSSNMDGLDSVRWTPNLNIVFNSMEGGRDGIWTMEADGKNRKPLTTSETVDYNPSVTTDGRYVVFVSERTGAPAGWIMDIDGSNQKKLNISGFNPQAADGWVVYSKEQSLWKSPIDGGEAVRISEEQLVRCGVSQDGKMVACSVEAPGSPIRLALLPMDGSSPARIFNARFQLPARMRWTPDGRAVSYIGRENGLSDIWSQSIDGGEPKRLTHFKADNIFSFDWSHDNKLIISHGTSTSDVVLIRSDR